ncbi:MAG: N-acetylmuramoyl-L-alanine amidase [Firmicutes bacterium]|nr:N-acetylmuramoyl-L-alanine amidase [Bacillota bacterium]HOB34378.1 N-acetylmuramoyl-L-alanine amidase [Bacillota bacterium]HPZ90847.1 N-acetylmuramoyl-L-alanine amidase [Bacillota bacterium]HQE02555.1 N-acetylmuramoyl-L-alanine amidase [Bacillota bacterium]
MTKHTRLISMLVIFLVFVIGTSLAWRSICVQKNTSAEVPEAAGPMETSGAEYSAAEAEPDPPPVAEESRENDEQQAAAAAPDSRDVRAKQSPAAPEKKEKAAPAPAAPPPQPKATSMVTVTVDGLNVRPAPSTANQPIGVLMRGQRVEVLEKEGNWLKVKLADGTTAWIAAAYTVPYIPGSSGGKLAGRVIAIDPGHGGSDPGAVGVTGLPEKEVVLDVALRLAQKLRAQGAQVVMTRDSDVFIPLGQRVAIAEAAGAEIYVSVHANAHPSPAIGGTETYYYPYKGSAAASSRLADSLQRELAGALGLRDIGVKTADFLVIRQTSMPSALVELGFLSNAGEEALLRTPEFRQKAADALARAVQEYLK